MMEYPWTSSNSTKSTLVDLWKIPKERTIALVYGLERWENITEEFKKIKATIDHAVLRVGDSKDVKGMLLKAFTSFPSTSFSVMGIDRTRFKQLQAAISKEYTSKRFLYSSNVTEKGHISYFKTFAY
ncbi:hypothetical protein DSO57_1033311 [Entomophthora muscae]|uniref:Uncharacterized protein n=1 Tax=Entomophthora muscae TaxID=34485 RepID=A0ACC2T063_9FUNG|nr:hypothetical protein DSO57_1033311 [Entomophthora muscae]